MKHILFIAAMIIISTSCGGNKDAVETETAIEEVVSTEFKALTIGSGGGITGRYKEYVVNSGGEVFENDFDSEKLIRLGEMDRETTARVFHELSLLDPMNIQLNNPGNMNYYIEVEKEGVSNHIQWHDPTESDQEEFLDKFHFETMKEIAKLLTD